MTVAIVEREQLAGNLLTIREACEATKLGRTTLYNLIDSGHLQSIKIPGTRCRRVPRRAVECLLREGLKLAEEHKSAKPSRDRQGTSR